MAIDWKGFAWRAAGIAGAVMVLAVFLLFLLFTTGIGNRMLARLISPLTGGTVAVSGLSGSLPDHLTADSVEISDASGVWLRLEGVQLDWSAAALLGNHLSVSRLRAARILVVGRPQSSEDSSSDFRMDIAELDVSRLDLEGLTGEPTPLTARGSLHYVNARDFSVDISARRLDSGGIYRLSGSIRNDVVRGVATIDESGSGIIGDILELPGLDAVTLNARAVVTQNQNRLAFRLTANRLSASGQGVIDLAANTANLAVQADAAALDLRPDLSWEALALRAGLQGSLSRPRLNATLNVASLHYADYAADRVAVELTGDNGPADLAATVLGLRIPGNDRDVMAGDPLRLSAHINLSAESRPITFNLAHPLVSASGNATLGGDRTAEIKADLPSLESFAAIIGADIPGRGQFTITATERGNSASIVTTGQITGRGEAPAARLLGANAQVSLTLNLIDGSIAAARGEVNGAAVTAHLSGATRDGAPDYRWDVALSDVSRAVGGLIGTVNLQGTLKGAPADSRLAATGTARLGTSRYAPQNLAITLNATGLPRLESALLHIDGRFADAPFALSATLKRDEDNILTADVADTSWRGVNAHGQFVLPPDNSAAHGSAVLQVRRLQDVAPLLGIEARGSLNATADIRARNGKPTVTLALDARNMALGSVAIERLVADGTLVDPLGASNSDIAIAADGISAPGVSGTADAHMDGPMGHLVLTLSSDLDSNLAGPMTVSAEAALAPSDSTINLTKADLSWQEKTLSLAAPALFRFGDGISFDEIRASLAGADIAVSGRVTPQLALDLSANGLRPAMLAPFVSIPADGVFTASAHLTGSVDAPQGALALRGENIRPVGVSERGFAPTTLDARGTLKDSNLVIDATLASGPALQLAVNGNLSLAGAQAVALKANGAADLTLFNTILAANGRYLAGTLALDAEVAGTLALPQVTGTLQMKDGEFRDYGRGIRLRAIAASAQAQGSSIRVTELTATAGNGSISGSGTIDLTVPDIPVDIIVTARNARPLVSDLLTATMNADLTLGGTLRNRLNLAGNINVIQGEIKIPRSLPPQVASLDVRRPGQTASSAPPRQGVIGLDLTVISAGRMFVRGRGIDADMEGNLHVAGTADQPVFQGGLDMRRGTLEVGNQTLTFTSGSVTFDGTGLRNRLDPTLNFTAQTSSNGVTARLSVTGYASAPRVELSSTPPLPQDEIIARLLFQQSVKQLTPLQLAELAQALASLGGLGTGFNPVGALRQSLGLDRLTIGSAASADGSTSNTTVEVGKYINRDLYVGATQEFSGRTKAVVEYNITKNLKAQATVTAGTGATATTGVSPETSDSFGLTYEFEY